MKRGIFLRVILVLAVGACGVAAAAGQPKALSLRLGWISELKYQHAVGPGFIEGGVGNPWMAPCVAATVTYNYVPWKYENGRGGVFELFFGGGLGSHTFIYDCVELYEAYTAAGVVVPLGLQYRTSRHFQVGLTWRPMFGAFFGDVRPVWYKPGLYDLGLSMGYAF